MKKKIIIIFSTILLSYSSFGQTITDTTKKFSWTGIGVGFFSSVNKLSGVSFLLNITYKEKKNLYSLKLNYYNELQMFSHDIPVERYGDFGVLYGRSIIDRRIFHVSINGGIGFLGGIIRGEFINSTGGGAWFGSPTKNYKDEILVTPNIPIQLFMEFNISKSFGLGLNFYANFNFKRSIFGFAYILKIGTIRK